MGSGASFTGRFRRREELWAGSMVGGDFTKRKPDETPSLVETEGLLRATDVSEEVPRTTATRAVSVSHTFEPQPQRTRDDQRFHREKGVQILWVLDWSIYVPGLHVADIPSFLDELGHKSGLLARMYDYSITQPVL